MIAYAKHFESTMTVSFKISDNKLLKKYTGVWKEVSNLTDVKFDIKYFDIYLFKNIRNI